RAVALRHHAGDLRRQVGGLEMLDLPRAAFSFKQALPGQVRAVCKRRDHPNPGDDDAPHLHNVACSFSRKRPRRGALGSSLELVTGLNQAAFFSRNFVASPTVRIVSAASSGISTPNSSSNAITSSTVSRLSAPRSSMKLAFSVTFSASTPRCSTTIFFTR